MLSSRFQVSRFRVRVRGSGSRFVVRRSMFPASGTGQRRTSNTEPPTGTGTRTWNLDTRNLELCSPVHCGSCSPRSCSANTTTVHLLRNPLQPVDCAQPPRARGRAGAVEEALDVPQVGEHSEVAAGQPVLD